MTFLHILEKALLNYIYSGMLGLDDEAVYIYQNENASGLPWCDVLEHIKLEYRARAYELREKVRSQQQRRVTFVESKTTIIVTGPEA